jgi:hypothetical protein
LLFFVLFGSGNAGNLLMTTLTADFVKVERQKEINDTVRGTLYYFSGRMVITIHSPITQYMLIDSMQTLIYNPSEHAGIKINHKAGAFLPFFHTFAGFFKGNQVVPQVNFKVKESVKKGDSLYSQWIPRDYTTAFKGRFETVYCNDRPVRATTYDKKGAVIGLMTFDQDTLINGTDIPLTIATLTPSRSGPVSESVKFRNVLLNKAIPFAIENFKIPSDVQVKELE